MKSRKKQRKRALFRFVVSILFLFLLITTGLFFTWQPLIRIKSPAKQTLAVENFLRNRFKTLVYFRDLERVDWNELKAPLARPVLKRSFPFIWSLEFVIKFETRFILLNKYIRQVDLEGKLIGKPEEKGVSAESLLYYYPVEIQTAKSSIDEVYQTEIAPFIAYLYLSDSGLGPKVRKIQFDSSSGITLTLFQKPCLIGFLPENPEIFIQTLENKINKLEKYIDQESSWDEYVQFDFRFANQIICRKHQ